MLGRECGLVEGVEERVKQKMMKMMSVYLNVVMWMMYVKNEGERGREKEVMGHECMEGPG